jgi:formylglycine-generating enzyme required for sulfatase activity
MGGIMRIPYARGLGGLAILLIASWASAVTMTWTPIGNPGNPTDPNPDVLCRPSVPCGSVEYSYSIGTYEVTNAQYAEFLNAKAASDLLGLYDTQMGNSTSGYWGGITRSGSSGSYSYRTISGRENMPVNWVSFYDALRFANWMNNGQGNGDTETGAYTLLGGNATPSNGSSVIRNPGATIALTSEKEWYKAAYYDPSTSSYFVYPTGTNAQAICASPTAIANTANCLGAVGDLTPVGSYTGSASPYGTFDQGGNVWELTEAVYGSEGTSRLARGGSFSQFFAQFYMTSLYGLAPSSSSAFSDIGFRLVMVPEPGTGLLVIAGLLGLAGWRRTRA